MTIPENEHIGEASIRVPQVEQNIENDEVKKALLTFFVLTVSCILLAGIIVGWSNVEIDCYQKGYNATIIDKPYHSTGETFITIDVYDDSDVIICYNCKIEMSDRDFFANNINDFIIGDTVTVYDSCNININNYYFFHEQTYGPNNMFLGTCCSILLIGLWILYCMMITKKN